MSFLGGWYLWCQVCLGGMSRGRVLTPPPPDMGPRRRRGTHPPDMGYNRLRSASGRYASYWNAELLLYVLCLLCYFSWLGFNAQNAGHPKAAASKEQSESNATKGKALFSETLVVISLSPYIKNGVNNLNYCRNPMSDIFNGNKMCTSRLFHANRNVIFDHKVLIL